MKKRNLALVISAIALLTIGLTGLILGYALQGVDIFAWFTSKWGILVECAIGLYVIIVIIVITKDRISRL